MGTGLEILVIDDDQDVANVFFRALKRLGRVQIVTTAIAGHTLAQGRWWSAIVADLSCVGPDFDLWLTPDHAERVLYVTGHSFAKHDRRPVMAKPVELAALVAEVQRLAEGR